MSSVNEDEGRRGVKDDLHNRLAAGPGGACWWIMVIAHFERWWWCVCKGILVANFDCSLVS